MSTLDIIEEIHEGDIGTTLKAIMRNGASIVDISSATTKNIKLKKPSGAVITKAGSFTTDGTDGQLEYVTISGDLDESSLTIQWEIQAHIITPTGEWHSSKEKFSVFPNN